MDDSISANVEMRLQRMERHNRVLTRHNRALIVLLCASLAVGSIAVSNAQPTVITATEVRAQRFTLLDPNGGIANDWYTYPTRDGGRASHGENHNAGYSGWAYSLPF